MEFSVNNPMTAEEISALRQSNQEALDDAIEVRSIEVLGVTVCVLFEIHDGTLFQRVRLSAVDKTQPSYDTCMDILPYLGMRQSMKEWAASWAEVIDPQGDEPPRLAYNISQLVKPDGVIIH